MTTNHANAAAADRRPVDPPPVVQMRIFEGPHRETAKDITFMYNADFFLYASLHHAADAQPGRVSPQNGPPVLTGMPVSSMILLDRPEEAGYFIFSDLSVRHEGQYYLNFALMEEVKEDRDKDPDEIMSDADEITGPEQPGGRYFSFRTTVTTDVFDVFSAKRFPGLQESTQLSRTVAEQGCRVRIRRDVRMRRRPAASKNKGGDNGASNSGQADTAQKARVEPTQHARDRAAHNENNGQYKAEIQRRQSAMEYHPRPSFSGPEVAVGRPHHYGHLPQYGPDGQSLPPSPSYPPPPAHGTQFDPRSSYSSYTDRSPTHPYAPPGPTSRDNYTHRAPRPILAPKLEADDLSKPNLPPISHLKEETTHKRPTFTSSGSLPRILPQLAQHRPISPPRGPGAASYGSKAMMDYQAQLPPSLTGPYGATAPLTPLTPSPSALSSGSRKRTADEASLGHGPNGDGSSRHGSYSQPFYGDGSSRRDSYNHTFRDYNSSGEASSQASPSSQVFPGHNANGERSLRQCSSSFAPPSIATSSVAASSIATSKFAPHAVCASSNHGPMLPSEYYRVQTSQDEQPRIPGFGAMESDYRVSYPRSEPYIMSTPIYDRASDAPIRVDFPDLHA